MINTRELRNIMIFFGEIERTGICMNLLAEIYVIKRVSFSRICDVMS